MTSAKRQLFDSLKDPHYRSSFVQERVKSSIALQIRALREQRNHMTQRELGDALGMAQTWVSKLENPEYGKMTVATLLRLAEAFDADIEIKFRPFSRTINELPTQGLEYFKVPSFSEEHEAVEAGLRREESRWKIQQANLIRDAVMDLRIKSADTYPFERTARKGLAMVTYNTGQKTEAEWTSLGAA